MRALGLLLICAIGFLALQTAQAQLKCYVCSSKNGSDCTSSLTQNNLQECVATPSTESPSSTGSTSSTAKTTTTQASPTITDSASNETTTVNTTTQASPTITDSASNETTTLNTTTQASPTITDSASNETTTLNTTTQASPTISDSASNETTTVNTTTQASPTITDSGDNNVPNNGSEGAENGFSKEARRKRRSVIGRFPRVDPFADGQSGVWCYRVEEGTENTSLELGCTTNLNFCDGKGDGCKICNTDECNSAASNIAFASLIVSLVAALWLTK